MSQTWKRNVEQKACWAREWGRKHGNQGVVECSREIEQALENGADAHEILGMHAYTVLVRVWTR